MSQKACLIIGAGDGLGAALANAFAAEGLVVCVSRRPRNADQLEQLAALVREKGGDARACPVDARKEEDVVALVDTIEAEIGPLEVVIFNAGANVWFPITEMTSRVYSKVWEMAAFSGFLAGREAARVMAPRKRGTIIFTGASASLRGKAEFSAFAGAKHALRALAQSMAREMGPKGIHVAHVIIDGIIDGKFARENLSDIDARLSEDTILQPAEIAKNYVWLWKQNRSAWTHELDLRPWAEDW